MNSEERLINYLEGNIDFPYDGITDPVFVYVKYRRVYIFCLVSVILFNLFCSYIGIKNRESELNTIAEESINNDLLRGVERSVPPFLSAFLEVILSVDMLVYMAMGVSGLVAYKTNKSRHFNIHSYLCVGEIIVVIFMSYIHQIFLLAFFIRIVFYVFVRFLISMLHTILLIPQF